MKAILLSSSLFIFTAITPGYTQASQKIDVMLNLGLGVQTYAMGGLCNGASFELGFSDKISVGGFFDYARYGSNFGNHQWKSQYISLGIRGSYHLASLFTIENDKFDPYAGVSVGTRSVQHRSNPDHSKPRPRGIFPGLHMGGLYHFSRKIGGFAEMGWGIATVRLGVTGKF